MRNKKIGVLFGGIKAAFGGKQSGFAKLIEKTEMMLKIQ